MPKRSRLIVLSGKKTKQFVKHLEKDIVEAEVNIKEMKSGIKRDKGTIRYLKGRM